MPNKQNLPPKQHTQMSLVVVMMRMKHIYDKMSASMMTFTGVLHLKTMKFLLSRKLTLEMILRLVMGNQRIYVIMNMMMANADSTNRLSRYMKGKSFTYGVDGKIYFEVGHVFQSVQYFRSVLKDYII